MYKTEQSFQPTPLSTPVLQIIRKPEALKMLGISKSNFHLKINDGLLPPGINLGANSVGYLKHELNSVIVAMATNKTQEEIKILIKKIIAERQNLVA